jgi:SAM-dependent methyltransferase
MPNDESTYVVTPDEEQPPYMELVAHYEECLKTFGPTHKGVDWPNAADLTTRFRVMLDLIRRNDLGAVTVLDLGCGPGLLLDHLNDNTSPVPGVVIEYQGIDLSAAMIEAAKTRHPPDMFSVRNVLADPLPPQSVDYVIMNGVLTEKQALSFDAMEAFAIGLISEAFLSAKKGIAFNAMSPFVDWERDDLFHWPIERMMAAVQRLSPNAVIRSDYGLREYTIYVYRTATQYE